MPQVSIVLTCYNHIQYLPVCYEGILKQTFKDYEIIAVDDGSTDGTREWLSSNAKQATIIFNEKNLGTYGTINKGLDCAKGEYIAILNDDDLWAPEKLEKQLNFFQDHPKVKLVHTGGWFIDQEGQEIEDNPLGFKYPQTPTGNLLSILITFNRIIISSTLIHRDCFQKSGGFNENYYGLGDWEMWLRIAEDFEIGYVPDPLTFYRVHGLNACYAEERMQRDEIKLREWIVNRIPIYQEKGYSAKAMKRSIGKNYAFLGTLYKLYGEPVKSRQAYLQSLTWMPLRLKSMFRYFTTFLPEPLFRKTLRGISK